MTILEWLMVAGAAIVFWILSGWVVKVVGFLARLAVRILIVMALVGLCVYFYQKATGRPISTTVEWKT